MKRPRAILTVILVALVVAAAESALVARYFADPSRMTTNFSPALLRRELTSLAASPRRVVLLGDSVVWGYRLAAGQTAASLLQSRGIPARNLAFKAGSPANYYAVSRLLIAAGVRPQCIVLEINQKTFNQADSAYQTLHPAVASLAYPLLDAPDRALLGLARPSAGIGPRLDGMLSSVWLPYALRTDVRDTLYGENDAAPVSATGPDAFEGTYDLAPLGADNVAVHFLGETARVLRDAGVPVLAFMTPTNHALLHDYIDNKQYRANGNYLKTLLRGYGARVLDLDTLLQRNDFLDNDHLT
ncbi:MAG: hypothetical protein IAI50_14815, partial [Candidatus Eremiobacteraeota bacterium]|nr:hypothetical protein [Candidatus Eremiobacteraeota bacterium]